jgi:cation/acetate symporter
LIYLSPTIQVDILRESSAWFPLKNPALVTIPLSFAAGNEPFNGRIHAD